MKTAFVLALVSLLLVSGCSGRSLELETPPVSDALPQPANLSWWSRAAMDVVMRVSAWRGAHPGYVVLFARDGVQSGLAKQLVKRTPSSANLSRIGDLQDSLPFADKAS